MCFKTTLMAFSFVLAVLGGLLHSPEYRASRERFAQINEEISKDPGTSSPREENTLVPYVDQKKSSSKRSQSKGGAGKKADPLKEFVPSEKIPGEQAVDFPADI